MVLSCWITEDATPPSGCVGDWGNYPTGFATDSSNITNRWPVGSKNVVRLADGATALFFQDTSLSLFYIDVESILGNVTTALFATSGAEITHLRCCVLDNDAENSGIVRYLVAYSTVAGTIELVVAAFDVANNVAVGTPTTASISSISFTDFDVAYNGLSGDSSSFTIAWGNDIAGDNILARQYTLDAPGNGTAFTLAASPSLNPLFVPELIRIGWYDIGVSTNSAPAGQLLDAMCLVAVSSDATPGGVFMLDSSFSVLDSDSVGGAGNRIYDFDITGGMQGDSQTPTPGDFCRYAFLMYLAPVTPAVGLSQIVSAGAFLWDGGDGNIDTDPGTSIYTATTSVSSVPIIAKDMVRIANTNDTTSNLYCLFHGDHENFNQLTRGTLSVPPDSVDMATSAATFGSRSDSVVAGASDNRLSGLAGRRNCEMYYINSFPTGVFNATIRLVDDE